MPASIPALHRGRPVCSLVPAVNTIDTENARESQASISVISAAELRAAARARATTASSMAARDAKSATQ